MPTALSPELSPELGVLLAAASPSRDPVAEVADVDWDVALQLARAHRVSPLLARLVAASTGFTIPPAVRVELEQDRDGTTRRNLLNLGELKRIARAFGAEDIPAVALKGCALLERVYDDIGLRPMVDLDVLVPTDSIARAEAIVLELGYESARPPHTKTARGARRAKYSYPELVRSDRLVRVDLHRQLLPDAALAVDGFWGRSRPSDAGEYLVPSTEDLVLHLGLHFFRDRLRRSKGSIGQLADLAWSIVRLDPDWDVVIARAHAERVGGRLCLSLDATRRLVQPLVPEEVVTRLRPDAYSETQVERFVARRVLDLRPWYHPGAGRARAATALLRPFRLRRDVVLHRWMTELA